MGLDSSPEFQCLADPPVYSHPHCAHFDRDAIFASLTDGGGGGFEPTWVVFQ